jgi:hypothetical protein
MKILRIASIPHLACAMLPWGVYAQPPQEPGHWIWVSHTGVGPRAPAAVRVHEWVPDEATKHVACSCQANGTPTGDKVKDDVH